MANRDFESIRGGVFPEQEFRHLGTIHLDMAAEKFPTHRPLVDESEFFPLITVVIHRQLTNEPMGPLFGANRQGFSSRHRHRPAGIRHDEKPIGHFQYYGYDLPGCFSRICRSTPTTNWRDMSLTILSYSSCSSTKSSRLSAALPPIRARVLTSSLV